jgi:hypothetical protein
MERLSYRHIIALNLTLLIFFSTIGVNLVTTFCSGCHDEHVSISYTAQAEDICACCGGHDGLNSCCTTQTDCMAKHHESTGHYEHLKTNTTEQKSKLATDIVPAVLFLLFIPFDIYASKIQETKNLNSVPDRIPISGRTILTLVCTFTL